MKSDICPKCNGETIEGAGVEIDELTATQECTCVDCGAGWLNSYTLTGQG